MIRRISLLFLLAQATVTLAIAQPLYKWQEADGSITFSPVKPANGVIFETVDKISPPPSAATTTISPGQTATGSTEPVPRIEYAPGNRADLPPAISRSAPGNVLRPVTTGVAIVQPGSRSNANNPQVQPPSDELVDGNDSINVGNYNGSSNTGNEAGSNVGSISSADSYKQRRCQDLQKRVTSLERRLRSRLTPEDMDNTVIHMARYQQSYDQYCVQ